MSTKSKSHIEQYHLHKDHPEELQFEIYPLADYLADSGDHALEPHIDKAPEIKIYGVA